MQHTRSPLTTHSAYIGIGTFITSWLAWESSLSLANPVSHGELSSELSPPARHGRLRQVLLRADKPRSCCQEHRLFRKEIPLI